MESLNTDNRPLYNSRIINTYIKLIKSKYSYINVNELLSYAKMEPYQVEDEGHWFTQEQVDLFYERLVKLTGNTDIAREAGRFAASPNTSGLVRPYILGHIGPAKIYEMIGKYSPNFTKASSFESKRIGSNKVEITVTPYEGVNEEQYQCENRIGYFEAISKLFNYKLPKVDHLECIFKGGKSCRYVVSWQELRSDFWKKIGICLTLFLFVICLASYFKNPHFTMATLIPLSFLILMILTFYIGNTEKKELNAAIDNLRISSDKLVEQVNVNYNNVLLINEIGQALSKQLDIESILLNVVQILQKRLDYDRGGIFLANEEKKSLTFRTGFGYTYEQFNILKNTRFHLDRLESKGVFVVSFRNQEPFLINEIDEIKEGLSARSLEFAKKMGAKSFICCPIIYEDESLGILVVDNIKTKRPLLQSDMNLLMGIASEIGISIHNSNLFMERERQFKSILQVLAASIDARDPLTAGHSEKVTEYTVGICRELGLPKDYCEMMRVAALLHDYGKIGVRDSVLKKEGKLSIEEHEEIKTHVEKTKSILEQVNFAGIYKEIPDIAGSHHEKIDGSGYPKGIKGEEIPLGARILSVADFFEAITSKRHYREPMPLDMAFELLKKGSGTEFDEGIIEAFITYYNREYISKMPKQLVQKY